MAAAVPLAIGGASSAISSIGGKGVRNAQKDLLKQQLAASKYGLSQAQSVIPGAINSLQTVFNQATGQFEPLMQDYKSMLANALSSQGKYDVAGDQLMNLGTPALMGALSGLGDLQQAYRPFMQDGAAAIERFLPSKGVLDKLLGADYANINQGYQSASQNIDRFAPRGGGRVSSLAKADLDRQTQLSTAQSQGRQNYGQQALQNFFQAGQGTLGALSQRGQTGLGAIEAGQRNKQLGISDFGSKAGVGLQQLQAALQALGIGGGAAGNLGQLGSSLLGMGLSGGQSQQGGQSNSAKGFGSTLVDIFNSPAAQDKLGGLFNKGKMGKSELPNISF
jgi:hypothetical protein